jgi:hypothetical protein
VQKQMKCLYVFCDGWHNSNLHGGKMAKQALDPGNTEKVADINDMNLPSFALVGFHFNLCSVRTVIHSTWPLHQKDHRSQ